MQTSAEILIPRSSSIARVRLTARDYVSLTKPRIIVLLVLTELTTMVIAARALPSASLLLWAALGGALASGGSGAINCWYDRDIDRVMARTCSRPLPSGRIRPWQALVFGGSLIAAAVIVFATAVNTLSAVLALGGGMFYVFIYTMVLKRTTSLNIVIGGAAGAFPPLVGWAAVRGDLGWMPLALFALVFLWTPPHFWSLALLLRDDYRSARVPMLPTLISTAATYRRILVYLAILIAASLLPALSLGVGYLIPVIALGGLYFGLARWAQREGTSRAAALLFHYSLAYLALVFIVGAVAAAV